MSKLFVQPRFRPGQAVLAMLLSAGFCTQTQAGSIYGFLTDKNGKPIPEAVLFALPQDTPLPPAKPGEQIIIGQEGYIFKPFISVMRTGGSAKFLSKDPHDHHIKAFSPAKTFEMLVKSNTKESAPVLFDKPGEVAMVCFFHDWMRGFVYLVDTPYFGKTDKSGNVTLNELPAGKYIVKAWAPTMIGEPLMQTVQVAPDEPTLTKFQLNFVPKPAPLPVQPPKKKKPSNGDEYAPDIYGK